MKDEGEDLTNIITKVVVPAEVQKDLCNQDDINQQEYAKFIEERTNTNEVSVWAKMKKVQLDTEKCKKVSEHKLDDQVVELKMTGHYLPAC